MEWIIFLVLSALCLMIAIVCAIVVGKSKHRSDKIMDPPKILFAGVVVSAVLLFAPIYLYSFRAGSCGVLEAILIAIHNVIRLFVVDGEFEFVLTNLYPISGWLLRCYTVLFSILFVLAPLLTFNFVLSFFKTFSAYKKYLTHFYCDVFIFSELNDRSLTLAKSLYESQPKKRFFIFTDVFENHTEQSFERMERARAIGAVCFPNDIVNFRFSFYLKSSHLHFFAIGEDQSENNVQALKIIEHFNDRENTNLYVFSTLAETEILMSNSINRLIKVEKLPKGEDGKEEEKIILPKIKVRRINEVRSLINQTLYTKGYETIFDKAYADANGLKKIHAVVLGMGQHGTEMTKSLAWFCQMDGYRIEINSFDLDANAEDRFKALCPELMDEKFNGHFEVADDAKYKISVHAGVDVNTKRFDDILLSLPRTTYVFVALGNDEANIAAAIKLRTLLTGRGYTPAPVIQAVVYDSDKKAALSGCANYSQMKYDIDFIGDLRTSYSEEVILASEIEQAGLSRHLKWGAEYTFWMYDFNYKSSVASAIHRQMKKQCGIAGIEKALDQRTQQELWAIRVLEHSRWNAYMRSEGFVYSGSLEKSSRNNLAKRHNCLVRFYELPLSEQVKDDD